MQSFSYEAVDSSGSFRSGVLEASSLSEALRQLEAEGLDVRSLRRADPADIKVEDAQNAFRQRLTESMEQREDWVPALRAMVEEMPSGRAKRETTKLVRRLEQDFQFEDFLASPQIATILPLLTSGNEAAFSTTRLRDWLSEIVRAEESLARRRSLLIYPTILFAITAAILIGLSFFLIPTFREMYEEFGLRLPAPTLWVFWAADQISTYLPRTVLIALAVILLAIPVILWWRKRALTNRILGKLAAGTSGNLQCMSKLTSTLAELLALSCPLTDALKLAGRAGNNLYYERATDGLSQAVVEGSSLTQLEHTTRLPPSVVRAMTSGPNQSPSIPLLRELAAIYSDRSRSRRNSEVEGLPAFGIVILGLIIGFIVISLFMPMVSLVSALA